MPLKEKLLLGTLATITAVSALLLASPEGHADPAPAPHCQPNGCDPLTLILGVPPIPPSSATTWQELILPGGLR